MKGIFKSFHNVSSEELELAWEDENTLFVFDTNVFLNLYGYAKQTRDDFFKIIEKLESRIWMPHQVGLEYQRRRLEVIRNEKTVFNDIENNLVKIENTFKGDFEKLALKRRFPKLAESTEKLENEIKKSISNYKKSVSHWNGEQPCVRSHDEIRDILNEYFDGNVGEKPSDQDWLDKLYAEGKIRYENKIPPGFKDAEKAKKGEDSYYHFDGLRFERQYGDLILWKQLLLKASDENVDNIIFITDDSKEDWWYKINSNGNKTIGPLAELQAEIYRDSNIDKFHMYSTSSFMEDGKTNLSVVVNESSIKDAGIQHLQLVRQSDDLYREQELLRTQLDSVKEYREQQELLRTLDPMKEFREQQEFLRSHLDPMKEYREQQELLRTHLDPMKEYREQQEFLRTHLDPMKEYREQQELLRTHLDPMKEYREQQELLRTHLDPMKEYREHQELLRTHLDPMKEYREHQELLRTHNRKSHDDDSNSED